jgi:hypothetical protein
VAVAVAEASLAAHIQLAAQLVQVEVGLAVMEIQELGTMALPILVAAVEVEQDLELQLAEQVVLA